MWGFVSKKEFNELVKEFNRLEKEHRNLYWDVHWIKTVALPIDDGDYKDVPTGEAIKKIIEHLGVKYTETPAKSSLEKEEYNG